MKGPATLKQAEDNWHTDMGALFNGERVVFRGKDLFSELGELSWFKYLMFGITGRKFDSKQLCLLESIWVISSSFPEPRIWNNRVAALSSSAKSTGALACSSAIAVSEANIYGGHSILSAYDFLQRAKSLINNGGNLNNFALEELKSKRRICGFGRPLINKDERISPLLEKVKELGFSNGPFLKLLFDTEKCLKSSRYRQTMNVAGLTAALIADLGMNAEEYYNYALLAFSAGIIPCHIDASNKKEGVFFPLSCQRLNYTGQEPRSW